MSVKDKDFIWSDGDDLKELFRSEIESLRILIGANDKNYNQRFDNVIEMTRTALAASDKAVAKAEQANEKRFDAVNEFRSTLADQQRTLIPRNEMEIMFKAVNEKVDTLNMSTIARQGEGIGQKQGISYVVAVAGVVSAIIGILFSFLIK